MTYRTTNKDLQNVVNGINREAGFDPQYVDIKTDGAYGLDLAHGGVKLVQYVGQSGAERDITPRARKDKAHDLMKAYLDGLRAGNRLMESMKN